MVGTAFKRSYCSVVEQWFGWTFVATASQQAYHGELLQLKAKAQGIEITTNKDEADMVYDYNWALDVAQVSNTLL